MPDARRQIWEIRVPRDVELTPLENRNEQEQNKDDKKKELREMENQRKMMKKKRDEWKDNEKWSFMKWSLIKITLKHNLGLFIISFKPWTLAYITYMKSPFWSNMDTQTGEIFP